MQIALLKVWIFRFVLTHSAQNDKTLVILSAAKLSINLKCEFAYLRCGYFANAQYDNMDFLLRLRLYRSK